MVNRNYHVAQALVASGKYSPIISVDFFPFTLKKKLKVFGKGVLRGGSGESLLRGMSYRVTKDAEQADLFHIAALTPASLPGILKKLGVDERELTVWSYNPMSPEVLQFFPEAFVVFDAVDNWIEHPSYRRYTERLEKAYQEIQERADVVFTVSESLIELFGRSERAYFIPNAVDAKHFITATADRSLLPEGIDEKKPLVGYHGVIQSRVNMAILDYVSEQLPDVQFLITGPVWKESEDDVKRLTKRANVFHRGMISYQELPALIQCFDVAIIPHKVDTLTQSMNPLKIYEYLAAGKPIIATAIPGADQFEGLMKLAVSPDDFAKKIRKALADDSSESVAKRQEMARRHSWEQRMELMLGIIEQHQGRSEVER